MKIYVQVLGTKTLDSDPSFLIFFDNKRYLFNAGEGTMRFCTEHKIRLSKINHVFLTELRPETIGGLPGLLLTIADTFSSSSQTASTTPPSTTTTTTAPSSLDIGLCGPPNTLFYLSTLRWFLKRQHLYLMLKEPNTTPSETTEETILKDEYLTVEYVLAASEVTHINEQIVSKNCHVTSFDKRLYTKGNLGNSDDSVNEPVLKKQKVTRESETLTLMTHRGRLNIVVNEEITDSLYGSSLKPVPQHFAISYICRTPDIPGKFDPKKAKELGLKPGPEYGKLTKGETITTSNGTVITPDQVIGPSRPGPVIAVISCPSRLFLTNLVNSEKWKTFTGSNNQIALMVHMSDESVVDDPLYINFIKSFGAKCQHIMINKKNSVDRCVFHSSATIQCKLNLIDNEIFGIPRTSCSSDKKQKTNNSVFAPELASDLIAKLGKNFKVYNSENLMKFTLEPATQFGFDKTSVCIPAINVEDIQKDFTKDSHPTLNALIEKYKLVKSQNLQRISQTQDNPHERIIMNMNASDMELVLLGTGAALPSKYRNVSAILIKQKDNSILMDCGEGTLGQIYRVYGEQVANDLILKNLACVWLSHMHADHHLGLAKILTRRANLYQKSGINEAPRKLIVIGPQILLDYLKEYEQSCFCVEGTEVTLSSFYEFILVDEIMNPNHTNEVLHQRLYKNEGLPLKTFYNIPVDHSCKNSYGLIIEYQNGFKLVYSGDTRPCDNLVEAGKNATVMIHEATFEDTLMDEAIKKKHSTTKEAVMIGMKMNAYRILLTHFSQRYPKVPVFDDEDMKGNHLENRTSIAFDMMRLNVRELPYFPSVIPAVQELFAEEIEKQKQDD
jgi:ribonuclease Z